MAITAPPRIEPGPRLWITILILLLVMLATMALYFS